MNRGFFVAPATKPNKGDKMNHLPMWAKAKRINDLFGINKHWLNQLVRDGQVRKRRAGESRQSASVYRIVDVVEYLEGVAA